MATRRPRQGAGLTSAMYVGDKLEATPMATPPAIRQVTKRLKVFDQPVRTEEIAKRSAAAISIFFRPMRSLSAPEVIDPSKHPSSAQLLAQPISCALLNSKYLS